MSTLQKMYTHSIHGEGTLKMETTCLYVSEISYTRHVHKVLGVLRLPIPDSNRHSLFEYTREVSNPEHHHMISGSLMQAK